jgi:hypothetical protein
MNRANGMSEIEGKAARASSEQVGETSEFQTWMLDWKSFFAHSSE